MADLIYLAGPYTKPDPVTNLRRMSEEWEKLTKAGYVVFLPHLTMYLDVSYYHPTDFWYRYDMAILHRCDLLLRVPGESWGADREEWYAREHRIEVFRGTAEEFIRARGGSCG